MINEVEAREMLRVPAKGQEAATPELTQILRFRVVGRWKYPAFQFDSINRHLWPAVVPILAAAKAARWSEYRLLNWMMRPHLEFEEVPAESLSVCGNEVLMAFLRDSAPEYHG